LTTNTLLAVVIAAEPKRPFRRRLCDLQADLDAWRFLIIGSLGFRELSYVEDLTDPGDIVLSRNSFLSPSGVFGARFGAHLRRPVASVLAL
jgi:hypothetical protein